MRIRYGAPLKAKNLITKSKPSIFTFFQTSSILGIDEDGKYHSGSGDSVIRVDVITGHKYLLVEHYTKSLPAIDRLGVAMYVNNTQLVSGGDIETYGATAVTVIKSHQTGSANIGFTPAVSSNVGQKTMIYYRIVLDLTQLFGEGNEPTAQQFLNRYYKYFDELGSGAEVTLDPGSACIRLHMTNAQTASCHIAGGSSEVYYYYNSMIKNGNCVDDTDLFPVRNFFTRSTSNNTVIFTRNSNTVTDDYICRFNTFRLPAIKNHKFYISYYARTTASGTVGIRNFPGYVVVGSEHILTNDWVKYEDFGTTSVSSTEQTFYMIGRKAQLEAMAVGDTIEFKKIICCDLTTWFGTGNEPVNLQEFKAKFNQDYYEGWRSAFSLTQYQIEAEACYNYYQCASDAVSNRILNGITMTNNFDGSYTLQGTASADCTFAGFCYPGNGTSVANHKFIIRGAPSTSTYTTYYLQNNNRSSESQVDLGQGAYFEWTANYSWALQIIVKSGTVINEPVTFWPQCIDLTIWFGAGNEPTTIAEFNQMFTKAHYPYNIRTRWFNKYMINQIGS